MPTDLPVRCACGSLRGVARGVAGARGNRVVCYCDDCQTFAHFLGHPERILDAHGGTDIFQTSSARLELEKGSELLACARLRPGGLLRWYASCCNTPIGNTLAAPRVAFVGLILSCTDPEAAGCSRDEALGPVRVRVNARFAKGDRAALDAYDRAPVSMLIRFGWMLLGSRLRAEHKRSLFFDAQSGEPSVAPQVLSEDELRAVERRRDAA